MLAFSESFVNESAAGSNRSVLALEPKQSQLVGRPILLKPGKSSIGSAEDCTVRLDVAGVEPHHCLIISGSKRILLRAWDSRTWLNERPVKEAMLRVGDHLVIGPVEFTVREPTAQELLEKMPEIQSSPTETLEATESMKSSSPQSPWDTKISDGEVQTRLEEIGERVDELTTKAEEIKRREEDLQRLQAELQDDTQKLEEEVERWEQEKSARLAHLENREQELDQERARLKNWEAELESDRQSLATEREQFQNEQKLLDKQHQELQQQKETLDCDQEALTQLQEELAATQSALEKREHELAQSPAGANTDVGNIESAREELARERARLESDLASLAEQQQEIERERERLDSQRTELAPRQQELNARETGLQQREAELEQQRTQLEDERAKLESEQASLAEERQQLEAEKADLARQRQEFEQQQAELNRATAELEAKQRDLNSAEAAVERTQQDLAETRAQLESERVTLEAAQRGLAESRQIPSSEQEQQKNLQNELESLREQFEAERQQFQEERESWKQDKETLEAEIKQLRADKDELDRRNKALERQVKSSPPATGKRTDGNNSPEWEDAQLAVSAYMERLLGRKRQEDGTQDSSSSSDESTALERDEYAEEVRPAPTGPRHPQDKEAVRANMDSLRQVANLSARAAIATHNWKKMRWSLITRAVITIVASIGAVVLMMADAKTAISHRQFGYGIGLIGVVAGFELFRYLLRAHKNRRFRKGVPVPELMGSENKDADPMEQSTESTEPEQDQTAEAHEPATTGGNQ